ncbi:endonuclease/exonuclease/phosphatase family protein [Plantactinospora sp. GCM10030261]|uniref:endonuclease/exonuclease/phosphatase family protein n=1 Tax=Plantactinospora sp. GCM10030261 TaxID=3273420 RepID=UPI003618DCDA
MRTATMNIFGEGPDWEYRRTVLAAGFADLAPDLVTLQEVVVDGGRDQAREILGAGYHLVRQREVGAARMSAVIASRWPIGRTVEVNLHLTEGSASTTMISEIDAPAPIGPLWLVHHLPDWWLDHEHERQLQAVAAARTVAELAAERSGHVVLAGDLNADPEAASVRFWTGHAALDGMSVCYRDAWVSARPGEPGRTFVPENPYAADGDWPFRRIDYVMVRCGTHGGPTLRITGCERIFDRPGAVASDHYGLVADLEPPGR